MSRGGAPAIADQSALSRLLEEPRYEVIPVQGIEQKVAALPYGATVTVTASPKLGIDRTLDVSTVLAARGFRVVPHLAARMVTGRSHLERLVQRLEDSSIREVFVIGGDADPPAGGYADAGDLLEELAGLAHPFVARRHRRLPGGPPADHRRPAARGAAAASSRSPRTWSRSSASTRARWPRGRADMRAAGVDLPVVVGLPGVVERRKLAEISLKTGVGRLAALPAQARPPDRHAGPLAPLRPDAAGRGGGRLRRATRRSASAACTSSPSTRWSRRGTGWPGSSERSPRSRRQAPRGRRQGPAARPPARPPAAASGSLPAQRRRRAEHRAHQDQRHADGDAQRERLAQQRDARAARRPAG